MKADMVPSSTADGRGDGRHGLPFTSLWHFLLGIVLVAIVVALIVLMVVGTAVAGLVLLVIVAVGWPIAALVYHRGKGPAD